jgi:hypothetical protein
MKFGFTWYAETNAQALAADIMGRNLDDKFILIRDLVLPGNESVLPLFLIGPPGAYAIFVTPIKGIFRAKGEVWFAVDAHREYHPARPNLVSLTGILAQRVQDYLAKVGYAYPKIEPVLMCTDPGIHVESVRPMVRVILSDAIDRFAATLKQTTPALNVQEVEEIAQLLANPKMPNARADGQKSETLTAEVIPAGMVGRMSRELTARQRMILLILGGGFFLALIVLAVLALRFS